MKLWLGVLLQHIKFTNLFEKSLQIVDSSIALPYWEFTYDNSKGFKYDNEVAYCIRGCAISLVSTSLDIECGLFRSHARSIQRS